MKKILLPLVTVAALFALAGCSNHQVKHSEFKKSEALRYLYEVTYNDYDWKDVTDWMESSEKNNDSQGFGCSSVHYGNFYGRSFDFVYTDMNEFLVRTNHENGHFASIGMAIANCKMTDERVKAINDGKDPLNEKLLPFSMVDGINENGVVCNTNVVPAHDLKAHEGEHEYFTHGTNPGKNDLFYQFMPRFILDNAKSAKHAVDLLLDRNITAMNSKGEKRDYLGVSKMGYELHCMIADKNDTYIVELVNDHLSVIAGDVMTNFYLSAMTKGGAGFERYQILFQEYQNVKSVDDMKTLIQKVQYSPCYRSDLEGQNMPVWPTEFAGVKVDDVFGPLTFYNADVWSREHWDEIKGPLQNAYLTTQSEEGRVSCDTEGSIPWISTHAETYDIENKTLHLCTQEDYDKWTEFKL